MNFLLIIFKNGGFKTLIVKNYTKEYLENYFYRMQMTDCTYLIYDLKLNKYGEGLVNRYGQIRERKKRFYENE